MWFLGLPHEITWVVGNPKILGHGVVHGYPMKYPGCIGGTTPGSTWVLGNPSIIGHDGVVDGYPMKYPGYLGIPEYLDMGQ